MDPFCGAVFVFHSKRADRIKLLVRDQTGMVLVHNQLVSCDNPSVEIGTFQVIEPTDGLSPVGKLVSLAALLGRDVRPGRFIKADIAVGGMSFHDSVFGPFNRGAVSDSEFCAGLRFCQHTTLAESA